EGAGVIWPDASATAAQLLATLAPIAGEDRVAGVTIADPSTLTIAHDPRVHVGTPKVKGSLRADAIANVLVSYSRAISACVPTAARMNVKLSAAPDGSVSSHTITGVTAHPLVCLENLLPMDFPRSDGGTDVAVVITIAAP